MHRHDGVTGAARAHHTTAICVPVRNEAALLPRFLDALAAQQTDDFVLCVLFDGCSDASAAIVERRAACLPFAIVTAHSAGGAPNAGHARREAMALGQSVLPGGNGMIVSTDADSEPDPAWLDANAAGLAVADVVAGQIVRAGERGSPLQDRVEAYYDALFALRRAIDPVPWEAPRTHHYTSGASLAFRAEAYRQLGGFEPLPSAEDARLVDAAHRAGFRVRRDAAVKVETSARREGRAVGGLADYLGRLDRGEAAATMAHPEDMVWRYRRQAAARGVWGDASAYAELARLLDCHPSHVAHVAAAAVNAEAFAMQVVPDVPGGERLVAIDHAEIALARLIDDSRLVAA